MTHEYACISHYDITKYNTYNLRIISVCIETNPDQQTHIQDLFTSYLYHNMLSSCGITAFHTQLEGIVSYYIACGRYDLVDKRHEQNISENGCLLECGIAINNSI